MKAIIYAKWCAQDLIKTAFLVHAGAKSEFFTLEEQETFSTIRQELEILNKRVVDILSKKPNPELIVDTAIDDLETILSKDLDDAFFDMGLDAQEIIGGIINDLSKGVVDDL